MTGEAPTRAPGHRGVRRGAQIGAGLGVAVATFAFLITSRGLAVLTVPVGGLVGMAIASARNRIPAFDAAVARVGAAARAVGGTALQWLEDERLVARFAKLLGPAVVLFIVTWTAAYAILPEGALAAANSARPDVISDTVAPTLWAEWSTIAAVNLLPLVGSALLNLLLGYRYAALLVMPWVIYYAVLLGTNSFGVPLAAPMAPSLAVLGRAGPYELAAYLFAVAVTYPLSRISLPWRPADATPRELAWRPVMVGLLVAAVVIVLAAWREAAMLLA